MTATDASRPRVGRTTRMSTFLGTDRSPRPGGTSNRVGRNHEPSGPHHRSWPSASGYADDWVPDALTLYREIYRFVMQWHRRQPHRRIHQALSLLGFLKHAIERREAQTVIALLDHLSAFLCELAVSQEPAENSDE